MFNKNKTEEANAALRAMNQFGQGTVLNGDITTERRRTRRDPEQHSRRYRTSGRAEHPAAVRWRPGEVRKAGRRRQVPDTGATLKLAHPDVDF